MHAQNDGLTPKSERFIDEYLKHLDARKAAITAGYSAKTADQTASRLLRNVKIKQKIDEKRQKLSEKSELTQEWVLKNLKRVYRRSMQAIPVCDREGNPLGEYKFKPNAANKSLELIGKHLGMFATKIQVEGGDNPLKIQSFVALVPPEAISIEKWSESNLGTPTGAADDADDVPC